MSRPNLRQTPPFNDLSSSWVADYGTPNEIRLHRHNGLVYSATSKYHKIEIYDLVEHGRALFLDGAARVFSADEFLFHEALVWPALSQADYLSTELSVVVIGDGDGGAIREFLKAPSVKRVVWVDIDEMVIEACAAHLGLLSPEQMADPRLQVINSHGLDYIYSCEEAFDIVVLSVTEFDGSSESRRFYSPNIYEAASRVINDGGVLVRSVAPALRCRSSVFVENVNAATQEFVHCQPYAVGLPAFGIDWGFLIASNNTIVTSGVNAAGCHTQFFTEGVFEELIARTRWIVNGLER